MSFERARANNLEKELERERERWALEKRQVRYTVQMSIHKWKNDVFFCTQRGGLRGWGKHGGWKGGGERKQVWSGAGEVDKGGLGRGGGRENVTHGWPLSSDGANDVDFNSNGSSVRGSG